MRSPLLLACALLLGSAVAACGGEDETPVPAGTSLDPRDEVPATGGLSLPANVTIDTPQVTPPPGADTTAGADPLPR